MTTLQSLPPASLPGAADLLAAAFDADPFFVFLQPDPARPGRRGHAQSKVGMSNVKSRDRSRGYAMGSRALLRRFAELRVFVTLVQEP